MKQLLRGLSAPACLAAAAFLAACGGSSHSSSPPPPGSGGNVQAIAVNGGPVAGHIYPDGVFTSVTVCVPGSSNCQTVDDLLVDTGSFGVRILASAIPSLNLPQLTGSGGTTLFNCVNFIDGSYLWGPVAQADVKIAGETASKISMQLIEDPTGGPSAIPTACSMGNLPGDEDNQMALGANGILGVGPEPEDCGPACAAGTPPAPAIYFTCVPTGNCQTAFVPIAQQLANPVVLFPVDNNGVLIEMQSLSGSAATASGSLIFGIGTQSNNQLGSATIFTPNSSGFLTTLFNQQTLNESFLDTGSNGYFFPDSSIPQCPANSTAPDFYCPTTTQNLSAQNVGANNNKNTVNFSVDNAVTLFQSGDAAFPTLAGPNGTGTCSPQNLGACTFDWGLPFFYGRSVFVAIDGQPVPTGAPLAPWWAY